MINDSGNRTKFESGAVRDIQEGKGRCDLLPLSVIGYWLVDPIFEMIELYRNKKDPYQMSHILNKFAEYHEVVHGPQFSEENRLNYRYTLVLEVAKHFEEGAKKYGDRNWEKGIPCDRYIDSAVRHYCKWRAGWMDEPHDRAFIWNILCCEWTRQRYGWNLEKLGEKSESEEGVKIGEQLVKGVYDSIRLNDGAVFTMTVDGNFSELFKVLGIENAKDEDQETADLKEACDIVKRHNLCYNSPSDVCFAKSCKECNHYQDPNVVYKAIVQLLEHAKKSLNGGEEVDNRYIRNVTGGVELYDDIGQYVGYVHGFTDSGVTRSKETEAVIRSIVQSSWGLLTLNPFTLEKIIEDHGYISDIHFIVELYKDPSDIKLPEKWQLIKRIAKEESK